MGKHIGRLDRLPCQPEGRIIMISNRIVIEYPDGNRATTETMISFDKSISRKE
jgi:hypothetical protein